MDTRSAHDDVWEAIAILDQAIAEHGPEVLRKGAAEFELVAEREDVTERDPRVRAFFLETARVLRSAADRKDGTPPPAA